MVYGWNRNFLEIRSFLCNRKTCTVNSLAQTFKVSKPYDFNLNFRGFDIICKENAGILNSSLILFEGQWWRWQWAANIAWTLEKDKNVRMIFPHCLCLVCAAAAEFASICGLYKEKHIVFKICWIPAFCCCCFFFFFYPSYLFSVLNSSE